MRVQQESQSRTSRTARMMPQLETGPQKWVVLGPTGLFKNALNAADMDRASEWDAGDERASEGGRRPRRSPVEEEDWLWLGYDPAE